MKKIMTVTLVGAMCAMLSGCFGIGTASPAEMASDVDPTYAPLPPLVAGEPLGRESIIGEWEGPVYVNTKVVLPRIRYVQNSRTATATKQTYRFFDDGKYVFTSRDQEGKEMSSNGDWTYENGYLTIAENKDDPDSPAMRMRVLCYDNGQVEFRMDDISAYESIIMKGGAESVRAWYETDGSLRTHMDIVNQGSKATVKMIQSPLRFTRVGDVE